MIEDFVKILALGYFGLEVEKKLGEKRKRQEKEWKEVLQKLKSIVFIV